MFPHCQAEFIMAMRDKDRERPEELKRRETHFSAFAERWAASRARRWARVDPLVALISQQLPIEAQRRWRSFSNERACFSRRPLTGCVAMARRHTSRLCRVAARSSRSFRKP
jgi:hypothetical protein